MPNFSGTTATSATSTPLNIPSRILSFSLVNKTGGSISVSVSVLYGSTNTFIYSGTIAANATYTDNVSRLLLVDHSIYFLTNGSCDYYFSITKPE